MGAADSSILRFILGRITVGIAVVDRGFRVVMWNEFMETHTGKSAKDVVGRDLFETFPELSRPWLSKKLEAVFVLESYAFTTWHERPYLLRMTHNRPITGGIDCMRQDCTFLPIRGPDGAVDSVCITISDVTDTAITEARLQEAMREIEILSTQDALTGLYNRRMLEERLEAEVSRAVRYKTPMAMMLFDFDHFKQVNDTHGHPFGDAVLKQIAQRILTITREADCAARYGGEEFAVIMPMTTVEQARIVAERFRARVEEKPVTHDGKEVSVTISAGVAELKEGVKDPYDLLSHTDFALYAAKMNGRNKVVCFHEIGDGGT